MNDIIEETRVRHKAEYNNALMTKYGPCPGYKGHFDFSSFAFGFWIGVLLMFLVITLVSATKGHL